MRCVWLTLPVDLALLSCNGSVSKSGTTTRCSFGWSAAQEAGLNAFRNVTNELHKTIFMQRIVGMLLVPVSLSIITSAYVDLPLKEQTSGAKMIQLMTGLSSERYWLFTLLCDIFAHLVSCMFCILPILFLERDLWMCQNFFKLGK